MKRLCENRVAVVTGAGRGIGREHALALAQHGAKVVVNDLGGDRTGDGSDLTPAQAVVAEIEAAGGEAVANGANVADFDEAGAMIAQAIDTFGTLDVVVNNAGILRDRMLANMSEQEWDAVINVHLKGTFAPAHHAAAYWRNKHKAGEEVDARLINTTSVSGIFGNIGQANYGAAKAGIASFTIIAALELARYGVTANAISPGALTRMTEDLGMGQLEGEDRDRMDPRWIAPICVWLASEESAPVTGRVFLASGRQLAIAEAWRKGPDAEPVEDPTLLGPIVQQLMAEAAPNCDMAGNPATGVGRPTPWTG